MAGVIYTDRISDITRHHLNLEIMENLATNTRILRMRANDGKEFCVAVDNVALAVSQDPQGVMNQALQNLQQGVDNYNQQLSQAQYANQTATAQAQLANMAAQQQYYMNQHNYLSQLAQAYPIIAEAAEEAEEIEEEVVKEVYKAAFDLRRFLEKLMHLPVALIDRMATVV